MPVKEKIKRALDMEKAGLSYNPKKAVSRLGAKPMPSGELPLVIDPVVTSDLLVFLEFMLSADEVQKGRSPFTGKIGTAVAEDLTWIYNLYNPGNLNYGSPTISLSSIKISGSGG